MTPPIFVISLARAAERRADIVRRLNAENIRHEIVEGVDGNALDLSEIADRLDEKSHMRNYDRPLYRGEIGCYLSHYNLWQRIIAEKIPAAVILEDDVVWKSSFAQVAADVATCGYEWDVALLHAGIRKSRRVVCNLGDRHQLVAYKRHYALTAGYLISLSGAKKLAEYCHCIRHPIDLSWEWPHRWQGRFYSVMPPVVAPKEEDSCIRQMAEETRENAVGNHRFGPSGFFARSVKYWTRKIFGVAAFLYYHFSPIERK